MCQRIGGDFAEFVNTLPADNVVLDVHFYNLFNSDLFGKTTAQWNIDFIYNDRLSLLQKLNTAGNALIFIGEFENSNWRARSRVCDMILNVLQRKKPLIWDCCFSLIYLFCSMCRWVDQWVGSGGCIPNWLPEVWSSSAWGFWPIDIWLGLLVLSKPAKPVVFQAICAARVPPISIRWVAITAKSHQLSVGSFHTFPQLITFLTESAGKNNFSQLLNFWLHFSV